MPGIIGPYKSVASTLQPLACHIAHLRHLTNTEVARNLVRESRSIPARLAKETAVKLSAYVRQGIEFHEQSVSAPLSIRPVLQYYSWLNFAVACIVAYRPPDFQQYRRHGVEDLSHRLRTLRLPSEIVKVGRGALPLFHSIISGEAINGSTFRFGELAAAVPMASHELSAAFGKKPQDIEVFERPREDSGSWRSEVQFTCRNDDRSEASLTRLRLERAMPVLRTDYALRSKSKSRLTYQSKRSWTSYAEAEQYHKATCRHMINFGGHFTQPERVNSVYRWHSVSGVPLIPTLTACLLLSFSLASVARYRPLLAAEASGSPISLLIDVFVRESDSTVIPALRNLLYRQEVTISRVPSV